MAKKLNFFVTLLKNKSPHDSGFTNLLKTYLVMELNDLLTTKEAAELLGTTPGYLRKLTALKKIPFYKPFGNRLYFKRAELLQYTDDSGEKQTLTDDDLNIMMTIKEAAAYLGLTVDYIYKLTSGRKIPFYKPFGNKLYFKRGDLLALMQKNRIGTADEAQSAALTYTLTR